MTPPNQEKIYLGDPPRLLLGAAAIFWGGMSGHALTGLLMALALEARHWVASRWDFSEKAFVRAWQLSIVTGFVVGFVMRFQMSPALNLLEVFTWIPVFFLPVMLASLYSENPGIPVTTFSYFARRKMLQERADGWETPGSRIFLGYPFLGLLVVMAGLGLRDVIWYGGGAALLILAGVFFAWPSGRSRPFAWVFAALLSLSFALAIASVINLLYYYVLDGGWYKEADRGSALESTTFLGRVGEIKLSPKIRWRVFVEDGPKPDLLRLSSYNVFGLNNWISAGEVPDRRRGQPGAERQKATARDFTGLFVAHYDDSKKNRFSYLRKDLKKNGLLKSRYRLRGDLSDEDLIPLDLGARALDEFATLAVEYNVMGATRAVEPDFLVSDLVVDSGEEPVSDEDPYLSDLQVGRQRGDQRQNRDRLRNSLREFLQEKGMDPPVEEFSESEPDEISQRVTIARLKQIFQRDFQYSLTQSAIPQKYQNIGVIPYFLGRGKRGHCEYFGTATALLLREMGMPSRYCVGYAVAEKGSGKNEYIVRGKHAHAWTRAYLGGKWVEEKTREGDKEWRCRGGHWVDVDTTPSVWLKQDQAELTWARRLLDWWQTWQENFTVWRSQASNRLIINGLLIGVGVLLLGYIFWRLRSTRLKKEKSTKVAEAFTFAQVETALTGIESRLEKLAGSRMRGQTMADWLQHASEKFPVLAPDLNELREIYQRLRFDPRKTEQNDAQNLAAAVKKLRPILKRTVAVHATGWWRTVKRIMSRPEK